MRIICEGEAEEMVGVVEQPEFMVERKKERERGRESDRNVHHNRAGRQ